MMVPKPLPSEQIKVPKDVGIPQFGASSADMHRPRFQWLRNLKQALTPKR